MQSMTSPDPSAGARPAEGQRSVRYTYLTGRLRNRQITMEEATELFGIMQGMLRSSEAGRLAAVRPPASASPESRPAGPLRAAPAGAPSDDLFLVGLLAMGAGAGLMAAMARRITEGASPASAAPRARSGSRDP